MQNQHTKPREKLAFEELWIHHHSGGFDGKEKDKLSLLHTAFQDMSLKWWKMSKMKHTLPFVTTKICS